MKKMAIILTTLLMGGSLLLFGGCRNGHNNKDAHIDFVFDYLNEILNLCKTIVLAHSSERILTSKKGHGTEALVRLPAQSGA